MKTVNGNRRGFAFVGVDTYLNSVVFRTLSRRGEGLFVRKHLISLKGGICSLNISQ